MRLYFSYDKGAYLTFEKYLRRITKKWLKENEISIERLKELAPHHDFDNQAQSLAEAVEVAEGIPRTSVAVRD